jgi:YVTN family beta-propeller protein
MKLHSLNSKKGTSMDFHKRNAKKSTRSLFRTMALVGSLCLASMVCAQSSPSGTLLVLSKKNQTIAMVDGASLKVLAKAPVGNDPHEVVASSDGKTAYVSNYGGGRDHTLAVVDLVARKAQPSIDLTPLLGPHGLDFVGGKLWFTTEGSKTFGRYDPATKKVDWIMGTGQNRTHMIIVSTDLKRIITSNVSSASMSIFDQVSTNAPGPGGQPRSDWNQTLIPVGNGSEGFDISPDGTELWVANAQDGSISVIDLATKKVVATLNVPVESANRLKFTPDGKRVLVSLLNEPDLVIMDAKTRTVVKRLSIGHGAAGIQMEPNGARAWLPASL